MTVWLAIAGCCLLLAIAALRVWRWTDARRDRRVWARLVDLAGASPGVFDAQALDGLPAPAQRYFRYVLPDQAPLYSVVEIEMDGEIGLGDKTKPGYRPMRARQILAPPHGLVWRLRAGAISGSDGATPAGSWTRFWLLGVAPIVRVAGGRDHHLSSFGRVVAEAAIWAPASLLPGPNVRWEGGDESTALAIVTRSGLEQRLRIAVAGDGRPTEVTIQRWSDANPDKVFRWQSFGGTLSEFREFDGYRLPTRVEGGNHFGADAYFPFFKARVTAIRFPQRQAGAASAARS